jgi:hypothetical protein
MEEEKAKGKRSERQIWPEGGAAGAMADAGNGEGKAGAGMNQRERPGDARGMEIRDRKGESEIEAQ